jgi:hypothetical protein
VNTIDATGVRLQLLANGYLPTPNLDKRCVLKGWASQNFVDSLSPETIQAWKKDHRGFKATGILVRNGLMPIDIDVADQQVGDLVLEALNEIAPNVYNDGPFRTGRPPKIMVLARWQVSTAYPDPFVRIASDKFFDEAGQGHQVEIFGGALTRTGQTSKQIGAFGPHSYEEDEAGKINFRKVLHEYSWEDDPTPLTVPLDQLPAMAQDQAWALLKRFEEIATERGWRRQQATSAAQLGQFVYDITAATRFDVEGGPDQVSYTELCALDENGLRVSGSFIDGSSHRRDKCRVSWCNKAQAVGVWDTESGSWHLPVEAKPPSPEEHAEAFSQALARLQEARVQTVAQTAPEKPKATDGLAAQAYWLLETHAYCPPNHSVVELFTPSDACELKPQAFQHQYLAWREDTEGPRGGTKTALATAAWQIHPDRHTVRGVRMRPDRDFPLYQEGGDWFKNTYLKPTHVGEGEIFTFHVFMEHLLPVPAERAWFLDWLAHKHRYPDIPGVAIVMVAAGEDGPIYGAGRGMLRDVLSRLFGERYVSTIDFDVFSGRSSQGVYTDWGAFSTLVTVSESKDTADSGRWTAQRAVYERLKEIVDPRPVERTFMRKGQPAFRALAFASYMVFSNNRDALQIPEDDRRVAALKNGARLPPEHAERLQAWMEQPGNIAALARFLEARDLSAFNVYAPLKTATKDIMQELARSELDEAYNTVRRRIGPSRLFTGEQVRAAVLHELGDPMVPSEVVKNQLMKKLRNDATQVADYRLTHTLGRHKILAWRDSVGASVAAKWSREEAQTVVAKTNTILVDPTSVVIDLPVTGSVASEKDEGKQSDT